MRPPAGLNNLIRPPSSGSGTVGSTTCTGRGLPSSGSVSKLKRPPSSNKRIIIGREPQERRNTASENTNTGAAPELRRLPSREHLSEPAAPTSAASPCSQTTAPSSLPPRRNSAAQAQPKPEAEQIDPMMLLADQTLKDHTKIITIMTKRREQLQKLSFTDSAVSSDTSQDAFMSELCTQRDIFVVCDVVDMLNFVTFSTS